MSKREKQTRYKSKSKHRGVSSRRSDSKSTSGKAKLLSPSAIEKAKNDTSKFLAKLDKEAVPEVSTDEFKMDPWQKEAFDHLRAGDSAVVDAPTTAGKTRIVEVYFAENLHDPEFRAAYTTPVKSLSNDKLREFREMFGSENVGIATGDIKENLSAPIVVTTLETYRNSLLGTDSDLGRRLVVFDEYQYIQDIGRGSSWEEAIILTPPACQILLLSASVANAGEFGAWIEHLGKKRTCHIVRAGERPVPLVDLVFTNGSWLLPDALPEQLFKRKAAQMRHLLPMKQAHIADRLKPLAEMGLTPTILYAGKRISCETLAREIARKAPTITKDERDAIEKTLAEIDKEIDSLKFLGPTLRKMIINTGVAWHHSGIGAPGRIAIETLVKRGELKFCVATMGLSLGINFAVRSALISDYSRPGDKGFTQYPTSEVLQMLGRAGRRGRDKVGFSLWPSIDSYILLGNASREKCASKLRSDPTTFLGLVGRGYSLKGIENIYSKSFEQFFSTSASYRFATKSRLKKALHRGDIPCNSPAAEAGRFLGHRSDSLCYNCKVRKKCHRIFEDRANQLSSLHLHLHSIEALDKDESLSELGEVARYFPQGGGFLIAQMITDGSFTEQHLLKHAQLMAALCLAHYKEPRIDSRFEFPFDVDDIEQKLEDLYPYELFPELYDAPFGKRRYPIIREFNPAAAYIIDEWAKGAPWENLVRHICTDRFAPGDMMSLLYRVGTYLQSISQAKIPHLAENARTLRLHLLREPLAFALTI